MRKKINRKSFLKQSTLLAGSLAGIQACKQQKDETIQDFNVKTTKKYTWKLATTWPPNFPVLGEGCIKFAQWVKEMSVGQMEIKVYGGGELIPALQCFDAVSGGAVEMANSASYYWAGRNPAASFFTSVPFGMNAQQMNAWLYYGGGLELWRTLYENYGLYPIPGGNTGVQMAGWFNREIKTIEDFKGLKMRIPGIGAKVLEKVGGTPVLSAGSEIYTNLERGVIDATEWIGPYHDSTMGFNEISKFYYAPGWHEPGSTLEFMINKRAFFGLPQHLQAIITTAAARFNIESLSEFEAKNNQYLQKFIEEGVDVRVFPDEVLAVLKEKTTEVLVEMAAQDEFTMKVYQSFTKFKKQISQWSYFSEKLYHDKM
jgi:TRAP-type mannitol/chloroaromatic compound transport system substrate-binding protein